ncbi:hypothetical protein H7K38_09855 [Mycobacterium alsense]|uniref:Uncharacterized protein n=1 Tax=Mycobacterium alsense TaxID=324058 RepID=A0AA41XMV2_9MYCO|nr:hypothetical protein [Mycobacterium alsense]MCV7378958.1 hypothetical protein [Mycobacterium alsense]
MSQAIETFRSAIAWSAGFLRESPSATALLEVEIGAPVGFQGELATG